MVGISEWYSSNWYSVAGMAVPMIGLALVAVYVLSNGRREKGLPPGM